MVVVGNAVSLAQAQCSAGPAAPKGLPNFEEGPQRVSSWLHQWPLGDRDRFLQIAWRVDVFTEQDVQASPIYLLELPGETVNCESPSANTSPGLFGLKPFGSGAVFGASLRAGEASGLNLVTDSGWAESKMCWGDPKNPSH